MIAWEEFERNEDAGERVGEDTQGLCHRAAPLPLKVTEPNWA